MNLSRIDLVSLRLLLAVAQTGSLTRGAEVSHLALAAASSRLKALEQRLGVALLERHARGVRLTKAGDIAVARARVIEAELARLGLEIEDYRQGATGHLKIVANVSAMSTQLPADLARFLRAHPGVRIDVSEEPSRAGLARVRNNQADLAIVVDLGWQPGLETHFYARDELVAMQALPTKPAALSVPRRQTGMGQPISLQELLAQDLILLQEGGHISEWLSDLARQHELSIRLRAQAKGFEALAQLVAAGLGTTVLPRAMAERYVKILPLVLRPLQNLPSERSLVVARRADDASPLVQALWEAFVFREG